jgi:universal stress protein A
MLPKTILVPTDFSDCANHALEYACALAKSLDASIYLANCLGAALPELNMALTQSMIDSLRASATGGLEKVAAAHPGVRFGRLAVVPGDARDGILELARELSPDLIVMGTHGRRGFSRLVLGSVTEHVVRRADCPVLTIRGEEK